MTVPEALRDLRRFAVRVGWPLEDWQAAALALDVRITTIVAPRQTGKSRALSLLAVHRSVVQPGHATLIISAGEEAAKRLVGQIRSLLAHPLLKGAVLDEGAGLITFANGSTIRAVPASEKQVRGWSIDLLLLDEAAFISEDLIWSAAFPTTAARPDARIVLASTPWGTSGAFWSLATTQQPGVAQHRWALRDAAWITAEFVAQMRATMSPERFAAEFDALFSDGGGGLFRREDLLNAVAPYRMTWPEDAHGGTVVLGADWGRARDQHAVVGLGVVDDGLENGHPVLAPLFVDTSRRTYAQQVETLVRWSAPNPNSVRRAALYGPTEGIAIHDGKPSGYQVLTLVSESNGVGAAPTEALVDRLGSQRVTALVTSQETKERAFGYLQGWLEDGRMVLPEDSALLRELLALTAEPTTTGGLRIVGERGHAGDRAMALSMAALAVPRNPSHGVCRDGKGAAAEQSEWVMTASGLRIPRQPRPRKAALTDRNRLVLGTSAY